MNQNLLYWVQIVDVTYGDMLYFWHSIIFHTELEAPTNNF